MVATLELLGLMSACHQTEQISIARWPWKKMQAHMALDFTLEIFLKHSLSSDTLQKKLLGGDVRCCHSVNQRYIVS